MSNVMIVNKDYNDFSLLTVGEVASLLHVHANTVRRWTDIGVLKSYRISSRGDRRFKREDINQFLNGMNNNGSQKDIVAHAEEPVVADLSDIE